MSELKPAAAIGYSVITNIGDDRQITFQHFVGEDETDATANAAIDRIMGFVDRLKAKAKVPELQQEKRQLEGQIAMAESDLAAIEADHKAREEDRNRRIIELQAREKQVHDEGYNDHVATGRTGPYAPTGNRKSQINAIKSDVGKEISEAVKQANEREVALQNLNQNLEMRRLRIRQIDEELAELQSKVS